MSEVSLPLSLSAPATDEYDARDGYRHRKRQPGHVIAAPGRHAADGFRRHVGH